MSDRVPGAVAAVSSMMILALGCTQTTTTNPSPSTGGQQPVASAPAPGGPGGPGGLGAQRMPMTDSARRVRDSLNAARRDSGEARLLRSIAGRENMPAESVFKNIKILKGVPAARVLRIMNVGFGRSLGVSCGFCHVPPDWDKDDKIEKETARLMFAMVGTINRDYMAKVQRDTADRSPAPPVVNCGTCHMGNPKPPGMAPPRPTSP